MIKKGKEKLGGFIIIFTWLLPCHWFECWMNLGRLDDLRRKGHTQTGLRAHGAWFNNLTQQQMKKYQWRHTPSLFNMWTSRPFPQPRSTKDWLDVIPRSARSSAHKTCTVTLNPGWFPFNTPVGVWNKNQQSYTYKKICSNGNILKDKFIRIGNFRPNLQRGYIYLYLIFIYSFALCYIAINQK